MSDLFFDDDVLSHVKTNLTHVGDLLEKPGREMAALDASQVGVVVLEHRMNDFGHEWHYGIKQLTKFAGTAVQALTQIQRTFGELDNKLAAALAPPAAQ